MMQPTDQMSTKMYNNSTTICDKISVSYEIKEIRYLSIFSNSLSILLTCLIIMHPIKHNFRCSIPPSGNIAGHLILGGPSQTKIQYFQFAVLVNCYVRRFQVLLIKSVRNYFYTLYILCKHTTHYRTLCIIPAEWIYFKPRRIW